MKQSIITALNGRRFNFLQRMRLWQKFVLLGAVAVALAGYPAYRVFQSLEESISLARTEESGLGAITASLELVRTLQDHRGSSNSVIMGDEKR
ncbi:MAG TPA: hypothetical protein VK981_15595, partial [Ramlibacter sp.]|nr:hypothetical protein [Ramlibacter sp.]